MKKALLIVLAFISMTAYSQRYRRSDGTAIQKPILVSNIPSGMGYYYDTLLFKFRPFQSTAEVLSFYPNLPDRQGSYPIYVKTGGTLASGVITGGVLSKWWFKNGTADSNLVVQDDYNALVNKPTIPAAQVQSDWNASSGLNAIANKPTIPVIPNFNTINNQSIIGTGNIAITGGISNGTPAATNGVHLAMNSTNDSIIVVNAASQSDLANMSKDEVDAISWGMIPDGSTDNMAVLQSLSAAYPNGATIHFKNRGTGRYVIILGATTAHILDKLIIDADLGVVFDVDGVNADVLNSGVHTTRPISIYNRSATKQNNYNPAIGKTQFVKGGEQVIKKNTVLRIGDFTPFIVGFKSDHLYTTGATLTNDANSIIITNNQTITDSVAMVMATPVSYGQSISGQLLRPSGNGVPCVVMICANGDYLAVRQYSGFYRVVYKQGTVAALERFWDTYSDTLKFPMYQFKGAEVSAGVKDNGKFFVNLNGLDLTGHNNFVLPSPVIKVGFGLYTADATAANSVTFSYPVRTIGSTTTPRRALNIDFYGDSKTADNIGSVVPKTVSILENSLGTHVARVRNLAVSGVDAGYANANMVQHLDDTTDINLVDIGTNNIQGQEDLVGSMNAIQGMYNLAISKGQAIIFCATALWYTRTTSGGTGNASSFPEYYAALKVMVKSFCAAYNIPFIDEQELTMPADPANQNLIDNIHPSSLMNDTKAWYFANAIAEVYLQGAPYYSKIPITNLNIGDYATAFSGLTTGQSIIAKSPTTVGNGSQSDNGAGTLSTTGNDAGAISTSIVNSQNGNLFRQYVSGSTGLGPSHWTNNTALEGLNGLVLGAYGTNGEGIYFQTGNRNTRMQIDSAGLIAYFGNQLTQYSDVNQVSHKIYNTNSNGYTTTATMGASGYGFWTNGASLFEGYKNTYLGSVSGDLSLQTGRNTRIRIDTAGKVYFSAFAGHGGVFAHDANGLLKDTTIASIINSGMTTGYIPRITATNTLSNGSTADDGNAHFNTTGSDGNALTDNVINSQNGNYYRRYVSGSTGPGPSNWANNIVDEGINGYTISAYGNDGTSGVYFQTGGRNTRMIINRDGTVSFYVVPTGSGTDNLLVLSGNTVKQVPRVTNLVVYVTVEAYSDVAGITANPNYMTEIKVTSDNRTGSIVANTIYQLWPDNTLVAVTSSQITR